MSRKAERGFSCFSYAAYQQRRFGYFAAEHAAAFEPEHPDGSGDRFRACAMMTRVMNIVGVKPLIAAIGA